MRAIGLTRRIGLLLLGMSLAGGGLCADPLSGASAWAAEPPGVLVRLRAGDDAKRTAALEELAALPADALRARGRALAPRLQRLITKDSVPRNRGLALLVYALAAGEKAVKTLSQRLTAERDPLVEQMLRPAFGALPPEPARKVLAVAAFDPSDPRRAALAAEALGWLPGQAGAGDLLVLLDSAHHWAVLAGACLGARRLRDPRAVSKLVGRLRHPDPCVRGAALEALESLTQQEFGIDATRWEGWWTGAEKGYVLPKIGAAKPKKSPASEPPDGEAPSVGPPKPPAPDPQRSGATSSGSSRGRPTFSRFFGVEVTGRRVAFVVDYSQSMWGQRRRKAESELIAAVKGLPSNRSFAVVLFNGKVWWFRPDPLPARPQEKLDLVRYLPEQETKNFTNIYDALEHAIGLLGEGSEARDPAPGLDELVLLSDGVPNRGKLRKPKQIVLAIEAWLGGKLPLHTVSLLDEPNALLADLAKRTGGRHVHHPVQK